MSTPCATMSRVVRVGLLYGGRSAEHEISILSARGVHAALCSARYEVTLLLIDSAGRWHLMDGFGCDAGTLVFATPQGAGGVKLFTMCQGAVKPLELDVVFPVLHGTNGEDGTVQGFLETVGLPYVGAGVLSSSVCMDKDVAKRLLKEAGLPIPSFTVLRRGYRVPSFDDVAAMFGVPFFLKPANAGSSVGISKIRNEAEYRAGLAHAFTYDDKVLAERFIGGRELEVAIIGSGRPRVSVPGEIVTRHDFYSYEAKYLNDAATVMIVPARISEVVSARVRALSCAAWRLLECAGMARVDFFLAAAGDLYINEVNTIPGFTRHSMFPVMWEHTGVPFPELVDELIRAALERADARLALLRTR